MRGKEAGPGWGETDPGPAPSRFTRHAKPRPPRAKPRLPDYPSHSLPGPADFPGHPESAQLPKSALPIPHHRPTTRAISAPDPTARPGPRRPTSPARIDIPFLTFPRQATDPPISPDTPTRAKPRAKPIDEPGRYLSTRPDNPPLRPPRQPMPSRPSLTIRRAPTRPDEPTRSFPTTHVTPGHPPTFHCAPRRTGPDSAHATPDNPVLTAPTSPTTPCPARRTRSSPAHMHV